MTSLWRYSRLTYYDLGPNFLTQGVELLPGEVWQVSKQNSQYFRSYLRKTTGGSLAPPAGRGLTSKFYSSMSPSPKSRKFLIWPDLWRHQWPPGQIFDLVRIVHVQGHRIAFEIWKSVQSFGRYQGAFAPPPAGRVTCYPSGARVNPRPVGLWRVTVSVGEGGVSPPVFSQTVIMFSVCRSSCADETRPGT